MIDVQLRSLTDIQLAECFETVSMEAGKHKGDWDNRIIDRLVSKQFNIWKELERRGPQSLGLLLPLLDHPDHWVRCTTAAVCLSLDRQRCVAMLRALYEAMDGLVSAEACFYLLAHDPEFRAEYEAYAHAKYGHGSPDEGH